MPFSKTSHRGIKDKPYRSISRTSHRDYLQEQAIGPVSRTSHRDQIQEQAIGPVSRTSHRTSFKNKPYIQGFLVKQLFLVISSYKTTIKLEKTGLFAIFLIFGELAYMESSLCLKLPIFVKYTCILHDQALNQVFWPRKRRNMSYIWVKYSYFTWVYYEYALFYAIFSLFAIYQGKLRVFLVTLQ